MAEDRADVPLPAWRWISGLAFEARIAMAAAGLPASDTIHGLRADALSAALDETLHEALDEAQVARDTPMVLVSFGLAGGLDVSLAPGTVVIADTVLAMHAARHGTDPAWRAALRRAMPHAVVGPVHADDAPLLDVPAKRQCRDATGALAVDMESHRVAQCAAAHGLPLVVCRVVADPAGRAVPPAALAAMGPAGDIAMGALARSLLSQPAQLAALVALARDTALARRALRQAARALEGCRRGCYGAVAGAGVARVAGGAATGAAPFAVPSVAASAPPLSDGSP